MPSYTEAAKTSCLQGLTDVRQSISNIIPLTTVILGPLNHSTSFPQPAPTGQPFTPASLTFTPACQPFTQFPEPPPQYPHGCV